MDRRVRDRLEHILEAITAIETYTSGRSEATFVGDRLLVDAVERNIERISEASRHVPEALKARYAAVPWRDIAGIGNVLRHDYPRIDAVEIWATVEDDLPLLKAIVTEILSAARRGED